MQLDTMASLRAKVVRCRYILERASDKDGK